MNWEEAVRVAQAFLDEHAPGQEVDPDPGTMASDGEVFALLRKGFVVDNQALVVDIATRTASLVIAHPWEQVSRPKMEPLIPEDGPDVPLRIIEG